MTTGLAGGIGSGMESFGNVLVKARLQDMQMKAQAQSQMDQLNAQIAGNLNLEQFRQKFQEEKQFPHDVDVQTQAHKAAMDQLLAGITGQKELEGVKAGYDLQKMDFANDLEAEKMTKAFGFDLAKIKAQAAAEGKVMDKKYLLEQKLKEHFNPIEHQQALDLIEAKNKGELAQITASGKQADETQMHAIAMKSALDAAPEPMVDFILAKRYGLHRDPKSGEMTGSLQQMANYIRARETTKSNNVGSKLQAFARSINVQDPEGAKKMMAFTKALRSGDLDSLDQIFADVQGGSGGNDAEDFLRSLKEGTGAVPGAESRPSSRPSETGFTPGGLPPPDEGPSVGEEMGPRGKNVLHGVINTLAGAKDAQGNPILSPDGIVDKPEGSQFYELTGDQKGTDNAPINGGKRLLSDLNKQKSGEKFIFNPQSGTIREAPPKEAIVPDNLKKKFQTVGINTFDDARSESWEAIKEATTESGMNPIIEKVRAEHPELEVQTDSLMTEDLKVALLRLRTYDRMNERLRDRNKSGGDNPDAAVTQPVKTDRAIADVQRLVQEAKLGKGSNVRAPKTAIGRGK